MTCDGIWVRVGVLLRLTKIRKSAEIDPCATSFLGLWGCGVVGGEGCIMIRWKKSKSGVSKANFDGVCVKLSFKGFFVKV